MRQIARRRICRGPELVRQQRRARKTGYDWKRTVTAAFAVVVGLPGAAWLLIWLPIMLAGDVGRGRDGQVILAGISIAAFGAAYRLGALLVERLRSSADVAVLGCLPVADRDILRLQRRRMLALSLLLLIPLLSFYSAFAVFNQFPRAEAAMCIGIGALQWLVAVASAFVMAALFPRWIGSPLAVLLWFVPLSLGFWMLVPSHAPRGAAIGELALASFVLLPTGWLNGVLVFGLLQRIPESVWLVAPTGLIVAALPLALGRLQRWYVVRELSFQEKSLPEAIIENEAHSRPGGREEPYRLDARPASRTFDEAESPTVDRQAARRRVLAGGYLAELDWRRAGWVERAAAGLLTPRERVVAELLVGGRPDWSLTSRLTTLLAAVTVLLLLLPRFGLLDDLRDLLCLGALGCTALMVLAPSWPGARWRSISRHVSPAVAWVPVGYREVTRVLMAVACVRALFWLPIACALGAVGLAVFGLGATEGIILGAKAAVAYVAVSQWCLLMALGRWDDFLRRWVDCLLNVALALLSVAALAVFLAPMLPQVWTTTAAAVLFGCGWLARRYDEHLVHRRRVDLVAVAGKSEPLLK